LAIVEFDGDIDEGDQLEIDFDKGWIRNLTKNTEGSFPPFPTFLQKIISKGGLFQAMEELA